MGVVDEIESDGDETVEKTAVNPMLEIDGMTSNWLKARGETSVLTQDMFQIRSGSNSSKKSRRIAKVTIVLLMILGAIAGLINGLVVLMSSLISKAQAKIIASTPYFHYSFLYFIISSVAFSMISCAVCKYFSKSVCTTTTCLNFLRYVSYLLNNRLLDQVYQNSNHF